MRQDRLLEIVGRIYQNPSCWDQDVYHSWCGTRHCIAGHAQIDSGNVPNVTFTYVDAKAYLDLSLEQANFLCYSEFTIDELIQIAITGVIP